VGMTAGAFAPVFVGDLTSRPSCARGADPPAHRYTSGQLGASPLENRGGSGKLRRMEHFRNPRGRFVEAPGSAYGAVPERIYDGNGLVIVRRVSGHVYFVFRFRDRFRGNEWREINLGPESAISLENVRLQAASLQKQVDGGIPA
jgi:hypothetical protein